jgi:hypothetical protein
MVFSIQRFLEDYFQRRRLEDADQYAVSIANLYDQSRAKKNDRQFLAAMRRVRTIFFRSNSTLNRAQFEKSLLGHLDNRFKKKATHNPIDSFPGGVVPERNKLLKQRRRTIQGLLSHFKSAVESRGIDSFWISRKQNKLRQRPESIAQALLAIFAKGVVNDAGLVLRELASGIGFVDVSIVLSVRTPHLIELKILTDAFVGVSQLEVYMKNENRKEGWLLVVEARESGKRTIIPSNVTSAHGTIRTVVIDINPTPPSKLQPKKKRN